MTSAAMSPASITQMLREPDEILLGFTRALRAAGVPVTQDRAHGFLAAVAVLGAGTMGARIAAHFANAGVPSYLFDIVPPDADGPARNKIAAAGLEAAKKSKPAAFMDPSLARLVTVGNFEDDIKKLLEIQPISGTVR